MKPLRIATVPYCNAFPLIHYLPECLPDTIITELYPSEMREQLTEQNIDLALLPVAELLHLPQGRIVSNCCIASNGSVRSVLLYSRCPIEQIQTLSLDTASRSSILICQLILRHFFGIAPQNQPLTSKNLDDCPTDAFVVIGDRALAYQPAEHWTYHYDLGALWKEKTGLPLVFAAWVTNSPSLDDSVVDALETARNKGIQNLEAVLEGKIALPLNKESILDYYRHAVVYTIEGEVHTGLRRFFELAKF